MVSGAMVIPKDFEIANLGHNENLTDIVRLKVRGRGIAPISTLQTGAYLPSTCQQKPSFTYFKVKKYFLVFS